MLQDAQ